VFSKEQEMQGLFENPSFALTVASLDALLEKSWHGFEIRPHRRC
jgi:hypothetical protein